jgi:hypothetical protein
VNITALRKKYRIVSPTLTERSRRMWAAAEASALGRGGIARIVRATGISRSTVQRGVREAETGTTLPVGRTRKPGGGRARLTATDPTLARDLEALLDPSTAGDPDSPLRWTTQSTRTLAAALRALGHAVSHTTVAALLAAQGYTLQANQKRREGRQHPDRDAQFRYINAAAARCLRARTPTISVDTKKKELVGDFKNAGRTWRPRGQPEAVRVHDFVIPEQGKAIPYGVYDLQRKEGWVSVGVDHDTAVLAVNAIRRWWHLMGRRRYPRARRLLITADAGGSNGARLRRWKWELQQFANRTGVTITVCHFPPGTSKWNKIEHRLFSHIARTWRGQPLVSLATIVSLIAATTRATGLRVRAELDRRSYAAGLRISDTEMGTLDVSPHAFRSDWNYTIRPHRTKRTRSVVS